MNMNACDGLALPLWKSMLTSRNWVDTNGVPSVCRDYFVKCFQQCEQARAAKLERWHKLKRIVADLDGVRKAHHGLEVEMNSRCKCWQFRIQFLQKNWDSNASNVNSPDTLAWAQSILHPEPDLENPVSMQQPLVTLSAASGFVRLPLYLGAKSKCFLPPLEFEQTSHPGSKSANLRGLNHESMECFHAYSCSSMHRKQKIGVEEQKMRCKDVQTVTIMWLGYKICKGGMKLQVKFSSMISLLLGATVQGLEHSRATTDQVRTSRFCMY